MQSLDKKSLVAVIGAGTMGAGIAQVASAAGHPVLLYDVAEGAAAKAIERLGKSLEAFVARDKMTKDEAQRIASGISAAADPSALANSRLVIEAVVEKLDVKQKLFVELEKIVGQDAVLATNTSSISVTAIASALQHPGRVVGMHFFNPAPVMKLVEIVAGLETDRHIAETIFETAQAWGKVPVHAKSSPGFIVNRVARPFYGEALRLVEEQVASPSTIDAILLGCGFRMGPFELMDLIGNDVNYAVSMSVFQAFNQDPRYRPSQLQLELVNAGRLGKKSGRGFYEYEGGSKPRMSAGQRPGPLSKSFPLDERVTRDGVVIALTDGRRASDISQDMQAPAIVYDLYETSVSGQLLAYASSKDVSDEQKASFRFTLAESGIDVVELPDWPGLVAMRTVAMIANEGFEAVMQGVASEEGVDAAMRFGVNYPRGPIAWSREIGLQRVLKVLEIIRDLTGDPRYRPSMALRMAVENERS